MGGIRIVTRDYHAKFSLLLFCNCSHCLMSFKIVNLSLFKDIVETHPGLEFLREAPDFHSRYIHTVSKHVTYLFKRASQYLVGIKFSNLSVKFVYFR